MCGIAAYLGSAPAAPVVYRLLIGLQHRGQESAGIAVTSNGSLLVEKGPGMVWEALPQERLVKLEHSPVAIGHVRYSTTGGYMAEGAQPYTVSGRGLMLALAFNGNIANQRELRCFLEKEGYRFETSTDTEVLAKLVHYYSIEEGGDVVEGVKQAMRDAEGSFSLVILTPGPRIIVARDPWGFKPLAYAELNHGFVAASETSALEDIGATEWVEVEPGEVIVAEEGCFWRESSGVSRPRALCAFEFVYFARPDTVFGGRIIHEARKDMGRIVARLAPTPADVVVPVPDSGRSAALGFSLETGIPMDEGLVKNRYMGRSFIMPPGVRERIAEAKYGVIRSVIEGKRVALMDDSIVRGTTLKRLIRLLKSRGAREVHVRVASPPIRYPCFMGIDFPTRRELVASTRTPEEIAEMVGAESLVYNTVEGLCKAIGVEGLCLACFTGKYPIRIPCLEKLEEEFARAQ